jgi:hypothetical protein
VRSRAGPLTLVKSYERSNPRASRPADGERGETNMLFALLEAPSVIVLLLWMIVPLFHC